MTSDTRFAQLVSIASRLEDEYAGGDTDSWSGSPFEWIRALQSRRRGKVAELLVERWLSDQGFDVRPSGDSEADVVVNDKRVEIKSSTLWQGGTYRFQQIRDQHYDFMICLGLSPSAAHCWVLTKALLLEQVIGQGRGQHGGAGAAETAWLQVDPADPEDWLRPISGDLGEALLLIGEACK